LFSNIYDAISMQTLNLLAQGAEAAPAAAEQAAGEPVSGIADFLSNPLILPVGLFVLFYFIFILPERRRKGDEAKMMSSLKKNDRIVTVGGIHGTIVNAPADGDVVTIKIDEGGNTRVKVNRSAISKVIQDGDDKGKDSGSDSND
jgi:preprotein translocase subunit YajC